jgi:hypothetical protein
MSHTTTQAGRSTLLDANGAADYMSVSPRSIRGAVGARRIPYMKVGRHLASVRRTSRMARGPKEAAGRLTSSCRFIQRVSLCGCRAARESSVVPVTSKSVRVNDVRS